MKAPQPLLGAPASPAQRLPGTGPAGGPPTGALPPSTPTSSNPESTAWAVVTEHSAGHPRLQHGFLSRVPSRQRPVLRLGEAGWQLAAGGTSGSDHRRQVHLESRVSENWAHSCSHTTPQKTEPWQRNSAWQWLPSARHEGFLRIELTCCTHSVNMHFKDSSLQVTQGFMCKNQTISTKRFRNQFL